MLYLIGTKHNNTYSCCNFKLPVFGGELVTKVDDKVYFERNGLLVSFADFYFYSEIRIYFIAIVFTEFALEGYLPHSLSLLMSKGHIVSSYSYFFCYHSSRWNTFCFFFPIALFAEKVRILWKTEAKIFSYFTDSSNSSKCYYKGGGETLNWKKSKSNQSWSQFGHCSPSHLPSLVKFWANQQTCSLTRLSKNQRRTRSQVKLNEARTLILSPLNRRIGRKLSFPFSPFYVLIFFQKICP